ncbi:MAG TPA: lamin tail domain-containing protein, partial [Pyrinomonadaceae bacterium]|nr:lamin tail domain-containing protein [Pyrinomonadaceae bacterium]
MLFVAALFTSLPALLLSARFVTLTPTAEAVSTTVVISQIYGGGGNSGATLTHDFIELFNRGTTTVDISSWSVQYASSGGDAWAVTNLCGSTVAGTCTMPPGTFYLVQEAQGSGGTTPLPPPVNASGNIAMSATTGKVALVSSRTALDGTCPKGNSGVVDFVGFGSTPSTANFCFEGSGPTPAPSNTSAVLRAANGCAETDDNASDFSTGSPNPRNSATTPAACVAVTAIHTIQGSGDASPLVGQSVTTTGVVTLLRTSSNAGGGPAEGFFLQTPEADADPNTSEGIFVFTGGVPTYTSPATPIAVGDELRVTGTVNEFGTGGTLTGLGSVTNIESVDTGNPLPNAVTITAADLPPNAPPSQPQLEKYEAMRLSAASLLATTPNDNFFDVETVLPNVPRPQVFREPGIAVSAAVPPDPTSGTPDPNVPRWDENPERLKLDTNGRALSPNNSYTSNVTFTNVAGPLDFASGEYRLIAEAGLDASPDVSAVAVPAPGANEFLVAVYNIEDFDDDATQRRKAALTIRDVMRLPAIVGAVEIFDLADLQALAAEVNSVAPGSTYQAFLVEADGVSEDGDHDVGYLVDASRVSVASATRERVDDTFINPHDGQPETTHDRPPFVLRATVDPTGPSPLPVIVVVNHLRSFNGIEPATGEGPRVRARRKAQAESLAGLLQELQADNPGVPVISVGDYQAFQFNNGYDDPLSVLKGNPTPDDQIVVDQSPDLVNPDFLNLVDELPPAERYTFNEEATMQALDHILVNQSARARNTRVAVGRVNADFPEVPASDFASNAARPERNSDHDPVVAYFSLGSPQAAGSLVISEFRFRGPGPEVVGASLLDDFGSAFGAFGGFGGPRDTPGFGGPAATFNPQEPNVAVDTSPQANDEFVEFYNNTDSDIFVAAADGSDGWALVAADGQTRFIIPSGTRIPARGHYLAVNNLGYSLAGHRAGLGEVGPAGAVGDILLNASGNGIGGYTLDIPDNSGVALFRTANPLNFNMSERLDAAGYAGVPELYREGKGFPVGGAETTSDLEYAFFRDYRPTGRPKDTGDNALDFLSADTAGTPGLGLGQRLGVPGPENSTSPVERSSDFFVTLLNPSLSSSASPNRVRKVCGPAEECDPNRSQFGTMSIRRTVTNNTGAPVAQLRFRIVEVTTFPRPNGMTADIRAVSSDDIEVTINGQPFNVRGTTVEEPPNQPHGGGWNTSLNVGFVALEAPLADGESVSVQFLLGVQQTGNFKFFLNIEALPAPNVV